jgi:hypothetical protein
MLNRIRLKIMGIQAGRDWTPARIGRILKRYSGYSGYKRATVVLGVMLASSSALAQNASTPGTVNLMSTFECIRVRAAFTGALDPHGSRNQLSPLAWLSLPCGLADRAVATAIKNSCSGRFENIGAKAARELARQLGLPASMHQKRIGN